MSRRLFSYGLVVLITLILSEVFHPLSALQTMAQSNCQTFTATNKTVCGRFLQYWQDHGGLAQQGYPITGAFQEVSDLNGQSYTVQYFERAVFESHPENQPPNDVELSQLGTFRLKEKYGGNDPALGGQPVPTIPPAQPPAQPTQPPSQPPPAGGTQTFTGQGSNATQPFQLKAGAARIHMVTTDNQDNFIVHLLDSNGNVVEFLANAIGPDDESTVINVTAGTYILDVKCGASWTITIQQ